MISTIDARPWRLGIRSQEDKRSAWINDADGQPLAVVFAGILGNGDVKRSVEEVEHLARRIAAVPELLDVLRACADALDHYADVTDGADGQPRANAALACYTRVQDLLDRLNAQEG